MPGRHYSGGGSHHKYGQKMPHGINGNSNGGASNSIPNGTANNHTDVVNGTSERMRGKGGNRKQWGIESYLADDENFPSFQAQLIKLNLQLRDIPADGNCLFRALGDQLEGHCRNHFRHRTEVGQFMRNHRTDFEPFVEDDMSFDRHMTNLQKLGTHAGNDAIVAFAKLHSSNVVIHQLNGKPLLIQGPQVYGHLTRQLHIAYHNGDHYSSVRRKGDNTASPAQIRLEDLSADDSSGLKTFKQSYNGVVSAKRDLEDIEFEVQMATNCQDMSRVRESLIECDYDVDAAIADLLQQMELTNSEDGENGSPSSQNNGTNTAVSDGAENHKQTQEINGDENHSPGSVLKTNGHSSVGGKGHKVHFREDSIGSSSGYGSMNSNGGARPKSSNNKKTKEERKLEKKRRAEEARRQKFLQAKQENGIAAHHPDVRDVTVVALKDGRFTHI